MKDYGTYVVYSAPTQAHILYQGALDRLLDDVATPMQHYRNTGHGNWSSIRMMAPVIEALAKNKPSKRNQILKQIGIEYPAVFWAMYRHGLLHNDAAPQSLELNGESIGWGFNWRQNQAAVIIAGCYSLNPSVIFDNLVQWLRGQLQNVSSLSETTVEQSVVLSIKPDMNSQMKSEFEQIMSGG
jgi:hypothetical protein